MGGQPGHEDLAPATPWRLPTEPHGSDRLSLIPELQAHQRELLADLVERGDAEVLAFEQFVAGADDQVADRLDSAWSCTCGHEPRGSVR